jgi:hypothetical protein
VSDLKSDTSQPRSPARRSSNATTDRNTRLVVDTAARRAWRRSRAAHLLADETEIDCAAIVG